MTQSVTGLFPTYEQAARAVTDLEAAGIPHSDISIVANNADDSWTAQNGSLADRTTSPEAATGAGTGATTGTLLGGGAGLLAGLGLLAIPGVGPVVAAGWLVATLTGAGIGAAAGGLVGSLTGAGVSQEHAHVFAEGVRRGGTLVSARVPDTLLSTAETTLKQSGAVDPSVRKGQYEAQGWTGFDPAAPAFSRTQAEQERTLY